MISRVGAIGDIHCQTAALERVIAEFGRLGVDQLVAVGDIVDGPGDANRTVEILEEHGIPTVGGNHERWLLEGKMRDLPGATPPETVSAQTRQYLINLPKTLEYKTPAGRLLVCHGIGADDMACVKPEHEGYDIENNDALQRLIVEGRYPFVLNGHTHKRMVRRIGSVTVINAGTLLPDYRPCLTLIDFAAEQVEFFDVHQDSIQPAETRKLGEWTALF